MDIVWYWIDPLLLALNAPVTELFRWTTLVIVVFLAFNAASILALLIDEWLYYRKKRRGSQQQVDDTKVSREESKETEPGVEEPFETKLRGRWWFYPLHEFGIGPVEFEDRDPLFLGYVLETARKQYQLYFGAEDVWYRFRNHKNLTDSSSVDLLSIFQRIWKGERQKGEGHEDSGQNGKEPETLDLNPHTALKVLVQVSDKPVEPGTEFAWSLDQTWRIEEHLGSFRIDVDGNRFFQGKETVTIYTFKVKDGEEPEYPETLSLLAFSVHADGRRGKISIWEGGVQIGLEEVEKWQQEEVVVSDYLMKEALRI